MTGYSILLYATFSGKEIIRDFIISLDKPTQEKIHRGLLGLEHLGPMLPVPYAKQVSRNLYELRIRGKVEVRMFYLFDQKNIWIIHAFVKKTMKIPSKELELVMKRAKELGS